MARVPLRLKEGLPHWRGGDSLNKTPHAQFPLPRTHTHAIGPGQNCAAVVRQRVV